MHHPLLADKLLYGFVFYTCFFLLFFFNAYFADDAIWTLSSHLAFHDWSAWAFPFWSHIKLLFMAIMALSLFAMWRKPHWAYSLVLAILMAILYQRNVWIGDSGDKLFVLLLIWHALLLASKKKSYHWMKLLFTFQLALLYFQNGYFKLNSVWMDSATALNLIWSYPGSAYQWIHAIAHYDLTWLNRLIPILEIILPVFLFTRWKNWIAGFFLFYHLLTALTLNIGFFSPIMFLWWAVFLCLNNKNEEGRTFSVPLVFALLWTMSNTIQTTMAIFHQSLPPKVDRILALSYLKQHWSMFSEPRNVIPQYDFYCFQKEQEMSCSTDIVRWKDRNAWDKRELGLMDKMALRKFPGIVRRDFHRYLCRTHPEFDAIEIKLVRNHFDEKTLKLFQMEEVDFGVSKSCK